MIFIEFEDWNKVPTLVNMAHVRRIKRADLDGRDGFKAVLEYTDGTELMLRQNYKEAIDRCSKAGNSRLNF